MRAAILACLLATGCASTAEPRAFADPAVSFLDRRAGGGAYREGWSGTGGDRIHYVESGKGPTVLFVHGFPSFWYLWADQLEAFRPCRRVIAIDAPGANLSARHPDDSGYAVPRLAARLDTLIADIAPDEKITLVGHDWGGALAWSYAEWKPERLARVAIFSAPPYDLFLELAATEPEQRKRSSYMQVLRKLDRAAVVERDVAGTLHRTAYASMVVRGILSAEEGELFGNALSADAVDAGIGWYRANVPAFDEIHLDRHAWPGRRAATRVPVLLVEGGDDRTFVPLASHAASHTASLTAVTLPGVGHWTPFEDPDAANAALGRFLGLPDGRCPAE